MKRLHVTCVLVTFLAGGGSAAAEGVPDLIGTWIPTEGAHLLDGPTLHHQSGTEPAGDEDTHHAHTSSFHFVFEGQDGRTFWGTFSSAQVSESLIGAISVDGERFVITDEDGMFFGTVVDNDTLDYCYAHIDPEHRAVACGLLVREQ